MNLARTHVPRRRGAHEYLLPAGIRPAARAAALVFLLATFVHAQNSQFVFDANGNLQVQIAEAAGPPQILQQPQNQMVEGEAASFSVLATGTQPLNYQWRFNGQNIASATNDALLLQNVSTNNEGEYRVVLTNPSGSVTSAPALLMIDSDGDGMADSWELTHFGNLNQIPNGDFDGDGSANLQEFREGTDPTDSNSASFHLLVVRDGGSVLKTPDQTSYTNGQTVTLTAIASSNELFHAWLGDIVTRSNPVTLVMTNNKTVQARFTPIGFTWTNLTSGDWDVATNWTPNLVPGLNDTAIITSGVTVTLNTPADCADVTLGGLIGPNLTGSGTLTVRGNLLWMAGTMSGSGRTILETGATLNIEGGVNLNTRTLENGGTALWTGLGSISMISGAVITNRAGALFHVQNAATFNGSGTSRFDNAGTFRKSANAGTTTFISASFNNSGTVEIQTGTLLCNGSPFTNTGMVNLSAGTTHRLASGGGSASGTFIAPATALVEWTGQSTPFTLNPGVQLSGAGLYKINGGTVTVNTDLTVENLDLVVGTLDGTGTVTVGNTMNWTAGTMRGGGRTIIAPGATLNAAVPSSIIFSDRTLENGGTVLWTGVGNMSLNSAVITNRAGALFHAQNAATINPASGVCRFDNAGTFRKSTNTGTTTVGVTFNNQGTTEIQTGTLQCGVFNNNGAVNLSAGTTNRLAGGGSSSGTFSAPATTLVEWTAGTFTLNTGAELNGIGLYRINGGTVTGNTDLTVENLDLVLGTLDGTGTVTVGNTMNWTAGTMRGGGRTIIAPGATLNAAVPNSITFSARTLENGGTVLWTGVGNMSLNSGVITNRAGALFHAQNAATINLASGVCRFDNAGTFRKSANIGTTTVGVNFNNYGTMDIRSGILAANGGYVSTSNARLNCALGGTTAGTNYGQLQVAGTVTLNGALSVDLLPGFTPATNDTFTVVTAGSRSGAFASFSYPSNRVTLLLSNTPNSVIVRVTGIVPAQPLLLAPEILGTDLKLTWTSVSNVTYRVEYNPDLNFLNASNWTALPGDVPGISNTASKLDALTPSNRFYRVRILP